MILGYFEQFWKIYFFMLEKSKTLFELDIDPMVHVIQGGADIMCNAYI